eukprot:m.225242 g.225242  ORF g.225242 m.225242 type:complete len:111 (-) comp54209_c0_seq3:215-547(-)
MLRYLLALPLFQQCKSDSQALGWTLLRTAESGNMDCIETLLVAGADVRTTTWVCIILSPSFDHLRSTDCQRESSIGCMALSADTGNCSAYCCRARACARSASSSLASSAC